MKKAAYVLIANLGSLGFSFDEALQIRRIAMTLHRWDELECGDGNDSCSWAIERDEQTGIPYRCIYPHNGPMRRVRIADREKGALKRLEAILANHPELTYYHQTDCRGASLYILRKADVEGHKIDSIYTRGLPVCD